jgi:hypothetical protein
LEGLLVGVFVGEADVECGVCSGLQTRSEGRQRAACTGAEVEDLMAAALIEDRTEAWDDGAVGVAEAPERLESVGEEIAQDWWEGWVIVDFDEGVVAHGA